MDNVVYENIAIDGAKVPFNKITSWLAPYIERGEYVVSGGFVKYLNAQGVEQTIALDKDSQSWQYAFIVRELSFYCPKVGREQVPGIDF